MRHMSARASLWSSKGSWIKTQNVPFYLNHVRTIPCFHRCTSTYKGSTEKVSRDSLLKTSLKPSEYEHTSLRSAALASSNEVRSLDLSTSEDLKCKNIMCEKIDEVCVCKLARFLVQNPFPNLESLNLSGNSVEVLPEPIFDVQSLTELNLSYNKLIQLPNSFER